MAATFTSSICSSPTSASNPEVKIETKAEIQAENMDQPPLLNTTLPPDAIDSILQNLSFDDWSTLSQVSRFWRDGLNKITRKFIDSVVENQDPRIRKDFVAFLHDYDPSRSHYSPMTKTLHYLKQEIQSLTEIQTAITLPRILQQLLHLLDCKSSPIDMIKYFESLMDSKTPLEGLLNTNHIISKMHQLKFVASYHQRSSFFQTLPVINLLTTLSESHELFRLLDVNSLVRLPQFHDLLEKLQNFYKVLKLEDLSKCDSKISGVFLKILHKTSLSLQYYDIERTSEQIIEGLLTFLSFSPSTKQFIENFNGILDQILSELDSRCFSTLKDQNEFITGCLQKFLNDKAETITQAGIELKNYGILIAVRCFPQGLVRYLQHIKITDKCLTLMKLAGLTESIIMTPDYLKLLDNQETFIDTFFQILREPGEKVLEEKFYFKLDKILEENGLIELIMKILPEEYIDQEQFSNAMITKVAQLPLEVYKCIPKIITSIGKLLSETLKELRGCSGQMQILKLFHDLIYCSNLLTEKTVIFNENPVVYSRSPGFYHGLRGNVDAITEVGIASLHLTHGFNLPPHLSLLTNLECLIIKDCELTYLPGWLNRLTNLKSFWIVNCPNLKIVDSELLKSTNPQIKEQANIVTNTYKNLAKVYLLAMLALATERVIDHNVTFSPLVNLTFLFACTAVSAHYISKACLLRMYLRGGGRLSNLAALVTPALGVWGLIIVVLALDKIVSYSMDR